MGEITARPMVYSHAGSGDRHLLLVHGLTGGRADFADWLEPLAALGWHVVAPDLRGHGDTGGQRDVEEYTPEHVVADLLALTDALGWDTFVLLGHSLGGVFAQHLALAHAERLEGLILMDTAHGPVIALTPEEVEIGVAIALDDGMVALADLIAELRAGSEETEAQRALRERRPNLADEDRAKFVATVPEMFAAGSRILVHAPDRLDQLRTLDMPTLVIVGELDVPFHADSLDMAAAIPGARLADIPGAGHSPQRETPDPWWDAVSAFLRGLRSPTPD